MKRKNIIFLVVLLVVLIILSVLIVIANTKPKNNLNENKEANLDENILDGSKENDSLENKENLDNNQTKEPVDNTESSENTGDEEQSGNDSANNQENNTESIQENNPSNNFTSSTPPSNSNQENNQSNVNENPPVSSSNQENNSETPVQPVKPQDPVQYNIDNDVPFYSYERVDAKTLDACLTKGNTIVKEKENTDCKQGCRIECEEVAGLHTHQTIGYMLTIYKQKGIEVDF